ncbi:hypothetical protein [Oceanidesulfovibrio marinus]|uniref:Uncharacterized protein n=1 Tax=Oceanidesulfovibrio marinus TaxID=370038 RepID=A0A6P1ZLV9_9BACT|nr:hypothetical protein [Oceanidesulfovibrio marinus]QJT08142.1 hypothetical protein E8L03_04035 [Oceanidesulfovibrio marinus]TVM35038.1 hypothetical protein DQK91_06450 [Oceanidesulfovibrio marinus]
MIASIRLESKTVSFVLAAVLLISVGFVILGVSHKDTGQKILGKAEADLAAFTIRFTELANQDNQDAISVKVTSAMVSHCMRLSEVCRLSQRRLVRQGDLVQLARFERDIVNVVAVATSNLTVVQDPRVLNAMLVFQSAGVEMASRIRAFRLGT